MSIQPKSAIHSFIARLIQTRKESVPVNIPNLPLHNKRKVSHGLPGLLCVLCAPLAASAQQAARPAFTPPPAAITSGSILQIIFSLLLVLAAVALVAWILKRINLPQHGSGNLLKVISGVAVGQRERVVLLEINDTWLVVGVAPGMVQTLHTLPKGTHPAPNRTAVVANGNFQGWLKQVMEKRHAR